MKTLIIEDDSHKLLKIKKFFSNEFPNIMYDIKGSYSSSVKALMEEKYDIAIIDMTLPTYEKNINDAGGRLRSFGGKDIIRQFKKRSIDIDFIILTQFTSFSDDGLAVSIESIAEDIGSKFPDQYLGTIVMEALNSKWENDLKNLIEKYNND